MKTNSPARLFIPLLIALLCWPLFSPTAQAQTESPITFTVQRGIGDYCQQNRWFPIRVTVENSGPDIQARAQASYGNPWGGQTTYALDLSLPSGARKEFFLYIFAERWAGKFKVSISENDKILTMREFNWGCEEGNTLLVGLLSETPSAYALLNGIQPLNGKSHLIPLRPADLPDQPQGWQPLDALVIAGADAGEFTSAQRAALRVWLAEGGKLLVTGGPNWQMSAAGLTEFLPLAPEATRRVESLDGLRSYFRAASPPTGGATLSTGALRKDAQVLIEQENIPLLTRRVIGFGEVYYLAADPGLAPLKDWDGLELVYNHLLGAKTMRPRWVVWPWENYATGQALATLPELGLPSFLLVCGWLGFYLLVVGPLNFIILREIKRPEWAWLTIPALVIAFTAFAYLSGFFYRGTRPTLNRLMVAQGWDSLPLARANAVIGLYSPMRARYDLKTENSFRFLPQGEDAASIQSGNHWLALEQGSGQLLPQAQIEIGGMKSVGAEGILPGIEITHDLTITVSSRAPQLEGRITNSSGITLKDVLLITPGSVTQLGDLPPGQSYPIRLTLKLDRNAAVFYYTDPNTYRNTALPLRLSKEENRDAARQDALLRAAVAPQNYNPPPPNWGIYLMGWIETPLLPVEIPKASEKVVDTTFYIHALQPALRLEDETQRWDKALFAWESSLPNVSPYYGGYGQVNQGYSLRFRPAFPLQFSEVVSLILTLDGDALPSQISLELWDYENRRWSQIEFTSWGQLAVLDAGRFVGPGGEVQVQLKGDPGGYAQIYESSIELVVRP